MTPTSNRTLWANADLLDELIVSADEEDVAVVDDIELSDADRPTVTAFLVGPKVFGGRMGGRWGHAWCAVLARLRMWRGDDGGRIPMSWVHEIRRPGVVLNRKAADVPNSVARGRSLKTLITRIPGHR